MADDLFGNIASGLGSLFGASDSTTSFLGGLGNLAGGAYSLYRGVNEQNQQDKYMNALYASQGLSDELLRKQAERAESTFYPIEDLQAQYALEDLKRMRDLQVAQQQYGIDRGQDDIGFAQDVIDPTRYGLLEFLSEGADPQKYMDIASTDVNQSFDKTMGEVSRAMSRQGINPNSGAMQNMLTQGALSQGAALAGARTNASRLSEDLDIQRKGQALNYWEGIPLSTAQAPLSGAALSQQAAQGFQQAASGLAQGAKLAGGNAADSFAGASAAFGNMGGYLNQKPSTSSTAVQQNPYGYR